MTRRLALILLFLVGTALMVGAAKPAHDACRGDQGGFVKLVQEWLTQAGYLEAGNITGIFGKATEGAVKKLQAEQGLVEDGVVTAATWGVLGRLILQGGASTLASRGAWTPLLTWETVDVAWPRDSTAILTDLATRTTIAVKRIGGTWHADVEPLTAADTQVFKRWFGNWSWARRAVIFRSARLTCGASINGKPHGRNGVVGNECPGHVCLHFLDSRLHKSGRMDAEHQRTVMTAAKGLLPVEPPAPEEAKESGIPVVNRTPQ